MLLIYIFVCFFDHMKYSEYVLFLTEGPETQCDCWTSCSSVVHDRLDQVAPSQLGSHHFEESHHLIYDSVAAQGEFL